MPAPASPPATVSEVTDAVREMLGTYGGNQSDYVTSQDRFQVTQNVGNIEVVIFYPADDRYGTSLVNKEVPLLVEAGVRKQGIRTVESTVLTQQGEYGHAKTSGIVKFVVPADQARDIVSSIDLNQPYEVRATLDTVNETINASLGALAKARSGSLPAELAPEVREHIRNAIWDAHTPVLALQEKLASLTALSAYEVSEAARGLTEVAAREGSPETVRNAIIRIGDEDKA